MSRASEMLRSQRSNGTIPSYTVAQASVLTGVSQKAINQYLDRELSSLVTIGAGFRAVCKDGLGYLRLNHDLVGALTSERRAEVLSKVMSNPRLKSVEIPECHLTVRTDLARSIVARKLLQWRQAKEMVTTDRNILSGEPCLKGTRLSVYIISDLHDACGRDEVFSTYPDLGSAAVDAALMYAAMFPRKGRPRSVGARLDKATPAKARSVRVKLPT